MTSRWSVIRLNLILGFVLMLSVVPHSPASAQEEIDLREMAYVATDVATDIFVGTVVALDETVDMTEYRYTPRFESIYRVQVGAVVKGGLEDGDEIQVRHPGGELNGEADYKKGDGPMLPDQRFLFVTAHNSETDVFEATGYLDSSMSLETDDDAAEWVARWTTAVNGGECAAYLDVLRLDGTVYMRRAWNDEKRFLEPEWVGEAIATVEHQDYALYGCSSDLKDGDASFLAEGTEILELKGYDPSFRVAVRLPDKHRWMYEAIWSESATTGADLLDIQDRVVKLDYGRSSFCNESGCVDYFSAGTDDPVRIGEITNQVLDAPVIPVDGGMTFLEEDETGYIVFRLDDESYTRISFNIATGITTNGIHLPEDLVATVLEGFDIPDGFGS